MTDSPDETVVLLRRWYEGDRGALDVLLGLHLEALHQHVRTKLDLDFRSLRREQDSMDLVQAAVARVLNYTPVFVPRDGQQFQALLRRIVANDVLNQLRSPRLTRREQSRERYGDSVLNLNVCSPSSLLPIRALERKEREAEVRAWARMALEFVADAGDRRLLLMAAVEERSWQEIGDELGMAADAARMRYQRLRPKLANRIRMINEGRIDQLLVGESA